MTPQTLWKLTVEQFGNPAGRVSLFAKLERLINELSDRKIPSDLWVDGSFVTEEPEPRDIDIAIRVMADVMDDLTQEQEAFLLKISADDFAYIEGLDTFVFSGFWIGHPKYRTELDEGFCPNLPTWADQFGRGRDDWLKGVVVLPVMESDLGYRIRN